MEIIFWYSQKTINDYISQLEVCSMVALDVIKTMYERINTYLFKLTLVIRFRCTTCIEAASKISSHTHIKYVELIFDGCISWCFSMDSRNTNKNGIIGARSFLNYLVVTVGRVILYYVGIPSWKSVIIYVVYHANEILFIFYSYLKDFISITLDSCSVKSVFHGGGKWF